MTWLRRGVGSQVGGYKFLL